MILFKHNFDNFKNIIRRLPLKRLYHLFHNSVYFYSVIIAVTVLYNKESVRNFSDFSVIVGLLFFVAILSIFYDLLYCTKTGKFSSKDFTLNYVTWNYVLNLIIYALIVVFGFSLHSLNKLENDLFETFNYHFFFIFSYLYQDILFITISFFFIILLQYLKIFLKYNSNISKASVYVLYFFFTTTLTWLVTITVSLLFKQYTNLTRFVNLSNINQHSLAAPNDSLIRGCLINDTRNSEWLTYVWEHTVNINNYGNYVFLFILFLQLLLTGFYIFLTFFIISLNDSRVKLNNMLTFFIFIFEILFILAFTFNMNLIWLVNLVQLIW